MSNNINLSQFFDDLICYLAGQDNLAGYEVEQAEAAKAAVAELIEAAEETQADAFILGMEIPRLVAAIASAKGTL